VSYSYDLATIIGKIRLQIPDNQATLAIFQDEEIDAFYAIEDSSLKRAVALALETIASNEVMVLKVIKTLDLTTDGAKTSDALLKRAALLREQAAEQDDIDGAGFDWAETVNTDFQARERVWKQALRGLP
jgi:hypothetical protein